ncbi:MAG: glycosyltransferase, partial [Clostridiaceae bacterium]|nr:glycosyltransferase [Clostridiaceae bacterium]
EGLPVSVTEAQMLGVVVLVTNYLTAREQVKDNYDGLVADCTAESIYNGIYKLYTDKEFYCKLKRSICERDFSFDVESFYSLV